MRLSVPCASPMALILKMGREKGKREERGRRTTGSSPHLVKEPLNIAVKYPLLFTFSIFSFPSPFYPTFIFQCHFPIQFRFHASNMFRESDIPAPRLHQTFVSKPNPLMQMASSNARFEEERSRYGDYNDAPTAEIIPTNYDTRYNPDHPDADYLGLVSKLHQNRRHTQQHASQRCNITQTERGIVGQDEDFIQRKRIHTKYNPITGEEIVPEGHPPQSRLIAGIGAAEGADHWKTSYHRFSEQEPTSMDMLTLKRQQEAVKLAVGRMNEHKSGSSAMKSGMRQQNSQYMNAQTFHDANGDRQMMQHIRENIMPMPDSHITGRERSVDDR